MIPSTAAPERKKMAWDYLKFVVGKEGQEVVAKEDQGLATRIETAERMVAHPGRMPEHDRSFIDSVEYSRYCYWPFPADEQWFATRSDLSSVWNGQLQAEPVCRKGAAGMTKAIEDFSRFHPEKELPVHTEFVPFDKRSGPALADARDETQR